MKVFFDFEFTRLHQRTTPVSIGMVSDDGSTQFYAEFTDYDVSQVDEWLEEHVMSVLTLTDKPEGYVEVKDDTTEMRGSIAHVVNGSGGLCDWFKTQNERITMASYNFSYDWVLFRELFRTVQRDLPENICEFPYDVATLFQEYGYDLSLEGFKEIYADIDDSSQRHNALFDAQVVRQMYLKLKNEYVIAKA